MTVAAIGVFCRIVRRRSAVTTTFSTELSPGLAPAAGGDAGCAAAPPHQISVKTDAVSHKAAYFFIVPSPTRPVGPDRSLGACTDSDLQLTALSIFILV